MNRLEYLQAVIASQKTPIEVMMERQASPDDSIILDVRVGDAGFLAKKIYGATHIPYIELNSKLDELDTTKKIYVYTWNYGCTLAKKASVLLLNSEFDVQEIAGGLEIWEQMQLPTENI